MTSQANGPTLPFASLRLALSHSKTDGSDWSLNDWYTAFAGEIGEVGAEIIAANTSMTSQVSAEHLKLVAYELADCVIYLDILAYQVAIELGGGRHEPAGRHPDVRFRGSVTSFEDVAALTAASREDESTTMEFMFARLATKAGLMGNHFKKLRRGDIGDTNRWIAETEQFVGSLLLHIATLATELGVSLADAVIEKFNLTSAKVGSPITLGRTPISPGDAP